MEEAPLISFRHFGFQYKAQAEPTLYDITFDVHRGERILIVGPSGCGKSTIASAINGLIPFAKRGTISGSLKVKGRETRQMSLFELSHVVGTVLQDTDAQFIGMTVAEDLAFSMENDCRVRGEMKRRVGKIAQTLNLTNHLSHAPQELSGGQKQRVSLGGVMVDEVEVYLFDEPLANLDPASGKKAMERIDQIQRLTGAALVMIEHRLEDALHCPMDRILLIQEGRLLADTTPDELLAGDLLVKVGVREPLYVTAMKYACVPLRRDQELSNPERLSLTKEDKSLLMAWYQGVEKGQEPQRGPIYLEAKSLEFSYENGFRAVKGVSAKIYQGEMLAIIGKNGAGKTSFAKLICGFEKPQGGELLLQGKDMRSLTIKERADHIGYVMQNPNRMLCKNLVFEEVAFGLENRGWRGEALREKVYQVLRICGLYPYRNWPISALSYGQKKRVTIASILALDPEMILLDEPTAGQDFRHYTEFMEFLRKLNGEGLTVVMITHDMHLMMEYATRALVFRDGEILREDTPAGILTDQEVVREAALKETSLYTLAMECGIASPRLFVQRFLDHDRRVRV